MDILNDILSALSVGLDSLYPNIPIYSEVVPNTLPTRCFLIGYAGETTIKKEIDGRYVISGALDITYLPPKATEEINRKQELNSVFARLALGLNAIQYNELWLKVRGHTRRDVDDVLHDVCKFSTFIFRIDDTPLIANIAIDKEEFK